MYNESPLNSNLVNEPLIIEDADKNELYEDDNIPIRYLTANQFYETIKTLLFAILPNISCQVSTAIVTLTNMHFIGHLNKPILLAAIGLGQTWANAFGVAIFISLHNGFITRAAQAFGANKHRLVGLYFQKSLILDGLLLIPLGLFLVFSSNLMILLGMEEDVSNIAGTFLRWSIPAFIAQLIFDCTKSLLIAQNIFYYQAIIQAFTCILNIFWCRIFVYSFELEIIGIALARTFTEVLNFILLFICIKKYNLSPQAMIPWTKESYYNLLEYLREILVIGASIYLEWIAFESTIIFVGILKNNIMLAAHAAVFNYIFFYYMFPIGLTVAMTTFIGNSAGEGKVYKAQRYALIGSLMGMLLALIGTILATRNTTELASFFTQEPAVSKVLSKILMYYGICTTADTFIAVFANILKPIGKERIVMKYFIIAYYCLGCPLSYILGVVAGYEIEGIWFGIGFEIHLMAILLLWQLWILDWDKEIRSIREELISSQEKILINNNSQIQMHYLTVINEDCNE